MLEFFIVSDVAFDAWNSPLKARYPSPTRSPADNGSEVLLTLYQGPLALTQTEIDEVIALGGARRTQDELKLYQSNHPEKWAEKDV